MNKKQIAEQTQDKVIEKYEALRHGEITKGEYMAYMLDMMENFIKSRIQAKHRTVSAEYQDLMQSGRLAVIERCFDYDPYKARPSVFFQIYIDDRMKGILDNPGLTTHYVGAATKLDKVARENGYTDCTDPRTSAVELQVLSGLSMRTVIETIRLKKIKNVSLEGVSEGTDIATDFMSPEKMLLKKEQTRILQEYLDRCTPLEQFLIKIKILSDEKISYRKLIHVMRSEEVQQMFPEELKGMKIDQITLEQRVEKALRKIKHNPSFKRYMNDEHSKQNDVSFIEQAADSDIEEAILSDFIELA